MNKDIFETLTRYKTDIESKGLNVYAIMLKGSQNYNLSDDESDIDANLIFIPTVRQLLNKESFKFEFATGEVTCHNIYSFAEIVAKGNPQWIEVCQTDYKLGESLDMFKHFKLNPSALKGMVMEKVTAFSKLYPSRAKYIEQYGYDPKQLHHIIRLYDCLVNDTAVYKYHGEAREYMMKIKRGLLPLDEAITLRDEYIQKLDDIYEHKKIVYQQQPVDYDLLDGIFTKYFCKGC